MPSLGPPPRVRSAFGVSGEPRPLPGGGGTSWLVDDVVLKPDTDPALQEWLGTALATIPRHGFRLSDVVPTRDGRWVCDGWAATRFVEGAAADHQREPRWRDVTEAGRAFHRATAALNRPALLDARTDWWALADRRAWGRSRPAVVPRLAGLVERLWPASALPRCARNICSAGTSRA